MTCSNGFMDEREKFNLSLPTALWNEYERLAEEWGHGSRWAIVSAGMLSLLAQTEGMRQAYIDQIMDTDRRGRSIQPLVSKALAGELEREIERIAEEAEKSKGRVTTARSKGSTGGAQSKRGKQLAGSSAAAGEGKGSDQPK